VRAAPYGERMAGSAEVLTLAESLQVAVRRDGSRPFITYYDDGTGERTELSVTTFDNWVSKTANFLRDDLDIGAGSAVGVSLPMHWLTAVWLCACWSVAAIPVIDPERGEVLDAAVIGPAALDGDQTPLPIANDVVAVSLAPLAASFRRLGVPLPDGVLDYTDEVRVHGDQFVAPADPSADDPALHVDGSTWTHAELVNAVRTLTTRFDIPHGARLMTTAPCDGSDRLDAILAAIVTPLVLDGSVVMCANPDTALLPGRAEAEHVTTWMKPPRPPDEA